MIIKLFNCTAFQDFYCLTENYKHIGLLNYLIVYQHLCLLSKPYVLSKNIFTKAKLLPIHF